MIYKLKHFVGSNIAEMTPVKNQPINCFFVEGGSNIAEMAPVKNSTIDPILSPLGSNIAEMAPVKNHAMLINI